MHFRQSNAGGINVGLHWAWSNLIDYFAMDEMTEIQASITLYNKKWSAISLFLISAAGVAGGIWIGMVKSWTGFFIAGLFVRWLPIAIVQRIPGCPYLHVDQSGFTISNLFRRNTVPWSAVDQFFVVTIRHTGIWVRQIVGFNFVPSCHQLKKFRQFAKIIGKCEGAIPDTYGKKANELAQFLNERLEIARSNDPCYSLKARLNLALKFAQEWGENYGRPIQGRLRQACPNLHTEELDHFNDVARVAMECGYDLIFIIAKKRGRDGIWPEWRESYLAQYPWVDENNLARLFSTGMYYAWKDGVGQ